MPELTPESGGVFQSLHPRALLLSQLLFSPGAWLSLLLSTATCSACSLHVHECELICVALWFPVTLTALGEGRSDVSMSVSKLLETVRKKHDGQR